MAMAWRGAMKVAGVGTAGVGNFGTAVEGGSLCKVDLAGCTPRALSAIAPWSTTVASAGMEKCWKRYKLSSRNKEKEKRARATRATRAASRASVQTQVAYCIKSNMSYIGLRATLFQEFFS